MTTNGPSNSATPAAAATTPGSGGSLSAVSAAVISHRLAEAAGLMEVAWQLLAEGLRLAGGPTTNGGLAAVADRTARDLRALADQTRQRIQEPGSSAGVGAGAASSGVARLVVLDGAMVATADEELAERVRAARAAAQDAAPDDSDAEEGETR